MLLTSKILLLFVSSIMIYIFGFITFIFDNDMVVPNPRIEKNIVRNINIINFDEIEMRGSQLNVDISRADTFGIRIEGPDNLVNNYLSVTKEKNKLLFEIPHEIRESSYEIKIKINLPSLKNIFADNSDHPIIVFQNPNGRIWRKYGRIGIGIKHFKEEIFNINTSGQTTVYIDSCQINELYADANNLSRIFISKCNISNVEYNFAGMSRMVADNVDGYCHGTLSDFTVINIGDKWQNRKVFYSDDYISSLTSLGEVLPALQWGSSQKKVKDYFINRGATIDSVHTWPKYGGSWIYFKNCNLMGLNVESISTHYRDDILLNFQFEFHDSISITKIDYWLQDNYGVYDSKRKNGKTWIVDNSEGKHISNIDFIHITSKIVTFQSMEWFELRKKMYSSKTKILDGVIF